MGQAAVVGKRVKVRIGVGVACAAAGPVLDDVVAQVIVGCLINLRCKVRRKIF